MSKDHDMIFKAGKKLYTYMMLIIFVALGAVVAGGISSRIKNAKKEDEEYAAQIASYNAEIEQLQSKVEKEQSEIVKLSDRYETELSKLKASDRDFHNLYNMYSESLENTRKLAGLTSVSGEGIIIRLDDSGLLQGSLVHDEYLADLVNVLKSAGAQAISINGQRIIPTSEILCLGPSIRVNGERLFAPYSIYAIGDAEQLQKAFLASDIYETIIRKSLVFDVQKLEKIIISPYSGDYYRQISGLY